MMGNGKMDYLMEAVDLSTMMGLFMKGALKMGRSSVEMLCLLNKMGNIIRVKLEGIKLKDKVFFLLRR
jgi:hypothetical protein